MESTAVVFFMNIGGQPAKVSDELINRLKGFEEHSQEESRELLRQANQWSLLLGLFPGLKLSSR